MNVRRPAMRFRNPGEVEQGIDDPFAVQGVLLDFFQIFSDLVGCVPALFDQIGVAADDTQGVVDFMGHPGRQLADGCHFFGPGHLFFHPLAQGDITDIDLVAGRFVFTCRAVDGQQGIDAPPLLRHQRDFGFLHEPVPVHDLQ